jgi:hypothetical protein
MSQRDWFEILADEDIAFIKRFVLASGSLKALADAYSVSYPTLRLRLDRLIAKIQVIDEHQNVSDFEKTARALHADGKIDLSTLKTLIDAQKRESENAHVKDAARTVASDR